MICRRYDSPVGRLVLGAEEQGLVRLWLPGQAAEGLYGDSGVLERCAAALDRYFRALPVPEDLPLLLQGTAFQMAVWQQLRRIPWGEVRTYGQLAAELGRPGAARAVGMACHRNPIPILVPCHRVVGRGGALAGYAGGLELKRRLLELEGVRVSPDKIFLENLLTSGEKWL